MVRPILPANQAENAERENAFRRIGFFILVPYMLIRFSYITDMLGYLTNSKTFLIIILGVPLAILTIASGGIQRSFRARPTFWAAALMLWMVLVVPLAFWKRGSIAVLMPAFETEFSMLFMIAGLAYTRADFNRLASTIALAGAVVVLQSFRFGVTDYGRFAFAFGSLSNANDYATHLIVCLPFLLLAAFNSRTAFVRLAAVILAALSAFLVLKTGSRAGLLSLLMVTAFLFMRGSQVQRIAILLCGAIIGAGALLMLPRNTLLRYALIFDSSVEPETQSDIALERTIGSTEGRKNLLLDSLAVTATHPLFGVGPGNFTPADAARAKEAGKRAPWLLTHNTYTEISSETGVPGLIFFLGMLGTAYGCLRSIYRRTRNIPDLRHIHNAAACLLLSFAGFCLCIFFASMSYRFYFPALVGLAVSFTAAANREIDRKPAPSPSFGKLRPSA